MSVIAAKRAFIAARLEAGGSFLKLEVPLNADASAKQRNDKKKMAIG